ncbi:RusA family crossover junction endodeoxyribonuclease [Bacillus cereus]|nr:RusA family crossover junction endodeoxyribonuclease [Bacillus cereus]NKX14807.1 RusA family crossover junction endodeoxyribonuclease [Bacillus cereus]
MPTMVRHFVVPGRAQAKQRPRLYRGVAYTPQATKDYEAKMRNEYVEAYENEDPLQGDLTVTVRVYFNKKNHGDLDNYVKTLDGLNKVAWVDDKQIKEIHAFLVIDKTVEERMEITISPLQ